MNLNNIVILDTETTGLNPMEDNLWSLALVPCDRTVPSIEVHVELPEDTKWDYWAKSNWKTSEHKWGVYKTSSETAITNITDYIRRYFGGKLAVTLAGHNVGFDVSFLKKLEYNACSELLCHFSHRNIDTSTLLQLLHLQGKVPLAATSSSGAFEYFGIKTPDSSRHTALGDAIATRDLLEKLLKEFNIGVGGK